jgi:hypothetical protein
MTKQEFIIKSLKPYFEDTTRCGWNPVLHQCEYKTKDGKKCAVGQYLNTNKFDKNGGTFHTLASNYIDFNDMFIDDAKNMLSKNEWVRLQRIHDYLAEDVLDISDITGFEMITGTDLTELKQMLQK